MNGGFETYASDYMQGTFYVSASPFSIPYPYKPTSNPPAPPPFPPTDWNLETIDLTSGFLREVHYGDVTEYPSPNRTEYTFGNIIWGVGPVVYRYGGRFFDHIASGTPDLYGHLAPRPPQLWRIGPLKLDPPPLAGTKNASVAWGNSSGVSSLERMERAAYITLPHDLKGAGNSRGDGKATGYALGGWVSPWTDAKYAGGRTVEELGRMLILDDSFVEIEFGAGDGTGGGVVVRNLTTPGVGPVGGAAVVHIPLLGVGTKDEEEGNDHEKGMLVVLGGLTSPPRTWTSAGGSDPRIAPRTMERVHLYDLRTKRWYAQNATSGTAGGKVPGGRWSFCAVAASARDGSSHQIYVYGGTGSLRSDGGGMGSISGEVWALSIPSFEWVLVDDKGERKFGHTCHLVKGDTMLVVGGRDALQDEWRGPNMTWMNGGPGGWTCAEGGLFAAYDLGKGGWAGTVRRDVREYTVPEKVSGVIGGGPLGGATKRSPPGGWTDPALGLLLGPSGGGTGTSPGNGTTPTPSPRGHSGSSSPPLAAIAGGIVGGVLFLAALCVLGFLLHRRRSRHPDDGTPGSGAPVVPETTEKELEGSAPGEYHHPPMSAGGGHWQQPPQHNSWPAPAAADDTITSSWPGNQHQ
ncbi:hypothetical protein DFH27DRAFT_618056 [Peziza echinospora]|nr:hypothetical protein DFH27DRAFT_618056 [Peziza echinospora]